MVAVVPAVLLGMAVGLATGHLLESSPLDRLKRGRVPRWEWHGLPGVAPRWLLATAMVAAVLISGWLTEGTLAPGWRLVAVLAAVGTGWGPKWWDDRKKLGISAEIRRSLPNFLDVMVVCTEAGMNLHWALERAAAADESTLGKDIRSLLEMMAPGQVLGELSKRYRMVELASLAAAVSEGEALGLPLAEVLRTQAEQNREAARRRNEAMAGALPVKLSVLTVFFFLPSVLAITVLPQLLLIVSRW